jgi:UDP-GlcNAc:undecaprenyl-phosphate/decaprenyl-phosphate GlcNAc-1-phosphate transferase
VALLVTLGASVLGSFAVTPAAARLATRVGLVDRPGPLKVQQQAVPYLGGVGITVGVAASAWQGDPRLLGPLLLALMLGLADDAADLPPPLRLGCEVVIGASVAAVVPVRGIGGAVVTVGFVVVLLNAVNLLDGLDGLAGGTALAAAAGFAVVLGGDGRVLAVSLAGALAGFLAWNRPPARVYMGDAGSYLVGTALALLLALAFAAGEPVALASGALLLVAVPVADTAIAIVRRLRARRPLLQGDRGHVYDQLVDRGWTAGTATVACIGAQAGLATAAVLIAGMAGPVAVAVTAVVVTVVAGAALWTFTSPASWSA